MNPSECDLAIIGGGPVGAALALALRDSGLAVVLLEARPPEALQADPRALALSYGSRLLLQRLGVWQSIEQRSAIRTIHISQKGSLGRSVLRADELQVPDLGYVLPYPALHAALWQAVQNTATRCLTGATVTGLHHDAEAAHIDYQLDGRGQQLRARLAVVADGGRLLEASHPAQVHDYGQSAVIAHLTASHTRADTAFERFTSQGPVALLPYRDGYELVWTMTHAEAAQALQWSEAEFLARLQQHFGDRVGRFLSVGTRSSFPLRLRRAPALTLPRTVLIGNAAQTMHPVAGQGFNMGLRDAWELAQVVQDHAADPGSAAALAAYEDSRRLDRAAIIRFTDGLVRLFSNELPLLRPARGAALSALDCLPLAKRFVARRMMFGANG
ncbi:MAG TPA: FAD-dependent monooxygenase [Gallionellaceae bacterium]